MRKTLGRNEAKKSAGAKTTSTESPPSKTRRKVLVLMERDVLLGRVQRGETSPADAEREASARGLGALESKPSDELFRPMEEQWWTLPMTIAWIAWRSARKVRENWDKYRRNCWIWEAVTWPAGPHTGFGGFDLKRRDHASEVDLHFQFAEEPPGSNCPSFNAAKSILWRQLVGGSLKASAVNASGEVVEIPASKWIALEWTEQKSEEPVSVGVASGIGGYERVRLSSLQVTAVWPPAKRPLLRLPAVIAPAGNGYVSLSAAALWIATRGGRDQFAPVDVPRWMTGYEELLKRIGSGEVAATGLRNGRREPIDRTLFLGIDVDPPCSMKFEAETTMYLCAVPLDSGTRVSLGDELRSASGVLYSDLLVEKSAVRTFWSLGLGDSPIKRPGRPSCMPLIEAEMRRRHEVGLMKQSLESEAMDLENWAARTHSAQCAKKKTIKDRLRRLYAELNAQGWKR